MFENCAILLFFFRIMRSEPNYVILQPCIIPEALTSEVRDLMTCAVLKIINASELCLTKCRHSQ